MHMFFTAAAADATSGAHARDDSRYPVGRLVVKKTGTGTCTVTLYEEHSDAILVQQAIPATNPYGFVAELLIPKHSYAVISDDSGTFAIDIGLDY